MFVLGKIKIKHICKFPVEHTKACSFVALLVFLRYTLPLETCSFLRAW